MENPFNALTNISVTRPKATIASILIITIALSSMAQFIKFDNSEDAFYPQNDTTELLYEIEDRYQASLDFVRIIDEIEDDDMKKASTWEQFATIEAELSTNERFLEYQEPLFGGSATSGPAGSALFWLNTQDPITTQPWRDALSMHIANVTVASEENFSIALSELQAIIDAIPAPLAPTAQELRDWNPSEVTEWQQRMDDNLNISAELGALLGQIQGLQQSRTTPAEIGVIAATTGPLQGTLGTYIGLQNIDHRGNIIATMPAEDKQSPWESDGPILISLVVSTDPTNYDNAGIIGDVQELVVEWTDSTISDLRNTTGDDSLRVFTFSAFQYQQSANIGKEIGILTSLALVFLTVLLYIKFRSVRDTAYVIGLTVLAIAATYGAAGIFKLTFNAAMNSIPILLLAIGVDYGIHVVTRIREVMQDIERDDPQGRMTLKDFDSELRIKAIRSGAVLTSAALVIAIFTDMVGFLSFRLSSQMFLVNFGTVIALGLFAIYVLSISLLPALMTALPSKALPLKKSGAMNETKLTRSIGEMAEHQPAQVLFIALILSLPMAYGMSTLEVGFDTADQFDDSLEVVQDFLMIADEFQSSPTPLYVVLEGDILSEKGIEAYNTALATLSTTDGVTGVPTGLWETLESERGRNPTLDGLLDNLTTEEEFDALQSYLLENETGRDLVDSLLYIDGRQTIISFQANTLDWQATVDFEESLSTSLEDASQTVDGEFSMELSGRALILAQISADVAISAITSTAIVAFTILFVLIIIQFIRTQSIPQAVLRGGVIWIPLITVVLWVYGIMGLAGYQLNSQTVTIGALALGLGVDYAVHYVIRLEEEVELHPEKTVAEWTSKTTATTGRAMLGAAISTAGGFAILNFSGLLPLRLFGQVFIVAISLAMISSVTLLPTLYGPFLRHDAKQHLGEMTEQE
ncbi:MAG: MMPL family transporter [Candidatus Thermoplasmatota archaeon]|nr:MMPL family transporter [Candidatus Thermoplasmatota archaeon]MEC8609885.1 MMPL family transporter [Candidatus Thermoplasmatota archaeon]